MVRITQLFNPSSKQEKPKKEPFFVHLDQFFSLKVKGNFANSLLVWILLVFVEAHVLAQKTFNVLDYGASSQVTDHSRSFLKTWAAACNSSESPSMIIPKEKAFLIQPLNFTGPCKSNISFMLQGTLMPPRGPKEWKQSEVSTWIHFQSIEGLTVDGGGKIDGWGKGWWDISCRYHPGDGCLITMPTAIRFQDCNNLHVQNIKIINSPQTHISLLGVHGAELKFLNLNSPANSPNTDGIHVSASDDVTISDSSIASGDDCISIGDSTHRITIHDIACGPGHGISIGSLGGGGTVVDVNTITVTRANFSGTTNGARIKTWQEGRGSVQNVYFSNLFFTKVENPIIIDQHYGDNFAPFAQKPGVHINNVTYSGAIGTSVTDVAVNLNCSSNVPCTAITLENIQLSSSISRHRHIKSSCNHAHGVSKGIVKPRSCLVRQMVET